MEPFAGKDKMVKYFHCWKDEKSLVIRYQTIKAIGVLELIEGLHAVTKTPLKIPVKNFKNYQGSTAGDIIGPVVMPRDQWEMRVAEKKIVWGVMV